MLFQFVWYTGRLEHCVAQHRVQELIEITTISRIPLAKSPKHPCCEKIRNSIPLLGALKDVNSVERFEELLLWLWPDLDLSQTLRRANKHQPQNLPATIIASPWFLLQVKGHRSPKIW